MHHDGGTVAIRYSAGARAMPYLESWEDNVHRLPDADEWPASLVRQVKSYVAHRSWFSAEDADALAIRLGGQIGRAHV